MKSVILAALLASFVATPVLAEISPEPVVTTGAVAMTAAMLDLLKPGTKVASR